jgi:hypothetical protein
MSDSPASHRLRTGRYAEPNRIYLLTTNTLDREPIFADFALGRLVVHQFRRAQDGGLAKNIGLGRHARPFSLAGRIGKLLAKKADAPDQIPDYEGGESFE